MSNLCESGQIENLLVARNLRGMQTVQKALLSGYYLRAAELVQEAIKAASGTASKTVLIGTGFPVDDTFETDGPLGAIALYRAIESMGARPVIVAGSPSPIKSLMISPYIKLALAKYGTARPNTL